MLRLCLLDILFASSKACEHDLSVYRYKSNIDFSISI